MSKGLRCRICPSESVIDTVRSEERDLLRVTSYIDFGDGVSPYRGEWWRLIAENSGNIEPEVMVLEELTIRDRFEKAFKDEPKRERPRLTDGTHAWY